MIAQQLPSRLLDMDLYDRYSISRGETFFVRQRKVSPPTLELVPLHGCSRTGVIGQRIRIFLSSRYIMAGLTLNYR